MKMVLALFMMVLAEAISQSAFFYAVQPVTLLQL